MWEQSGKTPPIFNKDLTTDHSVEITKKILREITVGANLESQNLPF